MRSLCYINEKLQLNKSKSIYNQLQAFIKNQ